METGISQHSQRLANRSSLGEARYNSVGSNEEGTNSIRAVEKYRIARNLVFQTTTSKLIR